MEVKNLRSGYGRVAVINRVNLIVEESEAVGLIGPNGAGKTTLIRTILGYNRAWEGEVLYRGLSITRLPAHAIARLGIGYVPERGGLLRTLTVRENIELALSMSKYGRDRIRYVTKLFRIIEERRNQVAGTLSGGEQRMLSIAMALLMTDKLMILDEPSSGLAPIIRRKFAEALTQVKRELGISLIISEQDPTLILGTADRVYVMEMGSIVKSGLPQDVIKTEVLREHYLGI